MRAVERAGANAGQLLAGAGGNALPAASCALAAGATPSLAQCVEGLQDIWCAPCCRCLQSAECLWPWPTTPRPCSSSGRRYAPRPPEARVLLAQHRLPGPPQHPFCMHTFLPARMGLTGRLALADARVADAYAPPRRRWMRDEWLLAAAAVGEVTYDSSPKQLAGLAGLLAAAPCFSVPRVRDVLLRVLAAAPS